MSKVRSPGWWARWLLAVFGAAAVLASGYRVGLQRGAAAVERQAAPPPSTLPRLGDAVPAARPNRPNVVLICIDTLRADHLGLYGYSRNTSPRIDGFAADALVFERAYATAPFTSPSVVSILTGLYPQRHRVRLLWQKLDPQVVTVADWLKAANYQTAAVISNLVLSAEGAGLAARFDHYDDAVDEPEPNRPEMLERKAARTTDAALDWLRNQREAQRPFFLWVHYIDPHGPYLPPDDAPMRFTHETAHPVNPESIADYARTGTSTDGNDYVDAYDGEIVYTDREVGRLLDGLDDLGLGANALVILTADHGEFLLEREDLLFGHGFSVDEAVMHVPLIVRGPQLAAGRTADPVSVADITPSILQAAGLSIPPGLDGRSLLTRPLPVRPVYGEGPDPGGSGGLERCFYYPDHQIVVRHGKTNVPRASWVVRTDRAGMASTRLPADPADPAYRALVEMIRSDPDPGGRPAETHAGAPSSRLVAGDASREALQKLQGLGYVK